MQEKPNLVDHPIKKADQDVLGRTDFANSVAELILSADKKSSSQVIGIYGKWGEGKTSAKNLVLEAYKSKLNHDFPLVEFSPWEYAEGSRLPFIFFNAVANCYGKETKEQSSERLADNFRDLGLILDAAAFVPKLMPIAKTLSRVTKWAHIRLSNNKPSLASVRTEIEHLLIKDTRRLVVVIDDLDRLSAENVRRMIQLVKANGDFPNTTYLLLCDQEYVSRALCTVVDGCKVEEGREYLEKVVHFGIDLPRIRTTDLRNYLVSLVQDVLCRHHVERSEFDLEIELPSLIFQLVHDLRDVKRLVAGFEFQLTLHCKNGEGTANIHLGDLIVLEAYRLFEPNFFHALYQNGDKLIGRQRSALAQYLEKESPLSVDWFNEQLFSKLSPRSAHTAQAFVQEHLGWLPSGDNYVSNCVTNARIACRLMHPECFESYFTLFVDPTMFFKSDFLRLNKALTNRDDAFTVIRNIFDQGRLRDFLANIESSFTVGPPDQRENFVSALTRAAELAQDNLPDWHTRKDGASGFSLTTHLHRCVRFLLERDVRSTADRSELLMKVFAAEPDIIVLPTSIVSTEHASRTRETGLTKLLTDDHYEKLKQICISRIEKLQKSAKLIDHVGEKDLREMWLSLGDKNKVSMLLEADFKAYPNVIHALWPFLGWSSSDQGLFYTIDVDRLEGVVDPTSVLKTLTEVVDLQPVEVKLRDCLAFALEAKRNDQPYNQDAQMRSVHKRGF